MAKKALKKGIFITFEGPEGSGKSTHARRMYRYLVKLGYQCVLTREPGGTRVGEKIRDILLDPANKDIAPLTELLLFETNRCQIIEEVIRPALAKKKIVICDRFNDSTVAYQGYAGDLSIKDVMLVDSVVTRYMDPVLTVLLDVDVRTGFKRAFKHRKKDRMELKTLRYHNAVRKGYLSIAKKDPRRVKVIRVRENIDETFEAVRKTVEAALRRYIRT